MEQRNNLVLQGTETFSRGQLDNVALDGGALVLEIGWQQREAVTALLEANGWADIACRKDFGGNDRCVTARRPK